MDLKFSDEDYRSLRARKKLAGSSKRERERAKEREKAKITEREKERERKDSQATTDRTSVY